MMHLPPPTVDELKDSTRANVQRFCPCTVTVRAAFAPHGPYHIAGAMDGVISKFDVNVRRTLEDTLIHDVRLICSSTNPSERVVERDLVGTSKVFVHHLQIARVECTIELGQCLLRLA